MGVLLVNIKTEHDLTQFHTMPTIKRTHKFYQWLAKGNPVIPWGLSLLAACWLPMPAHAQEFTLRVMENKGGKIVLPGQGDCLAECKVLMPQAKVHSLFAVPAYGYRFAGWRGVCGDTLGPLCTLSTGQGTAASAQFKANESMPVPVKALLLVHGPGANVFVWNDFVSRFFNNRCPVIYGGVVLDDDAQNPANQVYCYRVKLGYYGRYFRGLDQQGIEGPVSGLEQKQNPLAVEYLSNEIKAAMLGVLNRHPHSSWVVVGQGWSGLALKTGMQYDDGLPSHVAGFLALLDAAPRRRGKGDGGDLDEGGAHGPFLSLDASPDQTHKLNQALGRLAPTWW